MDDEGTHPENGFEKCATNGRQQNISFYTFVQQKRAKVFFNPPTFFKSYL